MPSKTPHGFAFRAAAVAVLALLVPAIAQGQGEAPAPPRHSPFLAGQFLIAEPKMGDPRFAETVIYMVNHDASGALGLVINKAYGSGPLDKFLKGFGLDAEGVSGDVQLHYGGPVQPGRGFVLHTSDYLGPGKSTIHGDVTFTTELKVLHDIGTGHGPKKSLFAFGYAGWGPGQLEGELARDDWVTAPGGRGAAVRRHADRQMVARPRQGRPGPVGGAPFRSNGKVTPAKAGVQGKELDSLASRDNCNTLLRWCCNGNPIQTAPPDRAHRDLSPCIQLVNLFG